jgi:hypothetical protein
MVSGEKYQRCCRFADISLLQYTPSKKDVEPYQSEIRGRCVPEKYFDNPIRCRSVSVESGLPK